MISTGKFYWDDGESIIIDYNTYNYYLWNMNFTVTNSQAQLTITPAKVAVSLYLLLDYCLLKTQLLKKILSIFLHFTIFFVRLKFVL